MKYAIQLTSNGQLVDYCETKEQAAFWTEKYPVEVVDTENASRIEVVYTELGGGGGYGHQEPSFTTFGGLIPCMSRLTKWMQETARTFGPDWREIRDFFQHCRLYVNQEDKSDWFLTEINKLQKVLYV